MSSPYPLVRSAQSSREPVDGRQQLVEDASRSEPASEYRVPAQGVVRAVVGLRARRLGTSLLRELEIQPEVAAFEALREVCRDGRAPLGRDCFLLQARKQGAARLR